MYYKDRYKIGFDKTPSGLLERYSMSVIPGSSQSLVSMLADSLSKLDDQLVKDCGIKSIGFEDLGPSKEYYPNHGYYVNDTLILNSKLPEDMQVFKDPTTGKICNRFEHTLFHELGHGWDAVKKDLSVKPEWLELSGWSEKPVNGKVRIEIKEKGSPDMFGEWCYDPEAKFVRFYARRNPGDDFADTFSFYVAGLLGFVPENKAAYLSAKIGAKNV